MNMVLTVQNLVHHFPIAGSRSVVQAVNNVSFTVSRGETLSLVGESGSGKTTVGRCILGLINPTAGEISFHGERIGKRHNVRRRNLRGKIQLVFQEPAESLDPRIRIGVSTGCRRCGYFPSEHSHRGVEEVRWAHGFGQRDRYARCASA